MQLGIREMREEDIKRIMAIEKASFPVPWSAESYLGELKNPFATYLVVVEKTGRREKVLAYGGTWCVFEEAHITNVAVHPDYRGLRLGQLLLQTLQEVAVIKGAHKVILEVRPSNRPALSLYRRLGFEPAGIRKGYYTDNNEDALIMKKDINLSRRYFSERCL